MLRLRQKRLALKIARQRRDEFNGDEAAMKEALAKDENLVGIDPATIILIIELVMAAIKFFRNRKEAADREPNDDEVLAAMGE